MERETPLVAPAGVGILEDGFANVVCGVDGTRGGFEAARQAAHLTSVQGRLTLVAIIGTFEALAEEWGPEGPRRRFEETSVAMLGDAVDALSERARASLEWAEAQAGGGTQVTSIVVAGDVLGSLMDTAERIGAGLIVIGTHGGRRLTSAVAAEPSAMVLHDAAGSVLVARQAFDPSRFPTRIVVGLDGSPLSRAALQVGASLRRRGDGRLIVVTAGKEQDEAAAALEGFDEPYEHLALPGRPVDVLVGAARSADVVIVGSRGLHGGKALGSVSERVAFRAESSVLVVRDAGSRPGA